jgi:superkiller protein 3
MTTRSIFSWVVFVILIGLIAHQLPSIPGCFYFLEGRLQASSGHQQAAVASYQQAVRFDPRFARAYIELGTSYLILKKHVEAEASFKRASSIADDSCASCGLGMVYAELQRYDEADKAFKKAISLAPNDVCAYEQSGRMYYDEGKYQESLEAFNKVSRLNPRAATYHFLGNNYGHLGKFDKAADAYHQALQLDPDYEPVYPELGAAYYRLQCYEEAAAAFEQAIRLKRDDARAYSGLGVTQLALGNKASAQEQYRVLQNLEPKFANWLLTEINNPHSSWQLAQ